MSLFGYWEVSVAMFAANIANIADKHGILQSNTPLTGSRFLE
jgi:hypothetical protein